MDYSKKINELKTQLDDAKIKRARAESTLEGLNKQKEELLEEVKLLGVEPENLEIEIKNLENEIDGLLFEASKLLPKDI
ncbi:hypothetical protein [Miniphocaeibacter massiliensis]|uniref:hypothetical protein n=1 Tax=Miniphocaeibacter massiliensis TaxID=2041841 RepID=UPI000C08A855|nr:hypothetical protein [Miniphocaeibacter massiliensis]